LLDAFPSQTAFAKAPMLNTQAPYFYRFKLGNFEGTIVSDGTLPLGKPEDNFVGLTKPEMGKQLTDNRGTRLALFGDLRIARMRPYAGQGNPPRGSQSDILPPGKGLLLQLCSKSVQA
jgi:hypothetical protein